MNQNQLKNTQPYVDLIKDFVTDKIDAQQFEQSFLDVFKNDSRQFTDQEFEILNSIFYDVEDFVADDNLRDEDDLDAEQLKIRSKSHLKKLLEL